MAAVESIFPQVVGNHFRSSHIGLVDMNMVTGWDHANAFAIIGYTREFCSELDRAMKALHIATDVNPAGASAARGQYMTIVYMCLGGYGSQTDTAWTYTFFTNSSTSL